MAKLMSRRRLFVAVAVPAAGVFSAPRAAAQTPPPGELVTLLTPVRVFDSRVDGLLPGRRKLRSGESVLVTVSEAFTGFASAVFLNTTVTQTEGSGFLVIVGADSSGDRPVPQTSNINWWASGQTLANLVLTTVGSEFAVDVRCGGGGSTHVVLDVLGYVPAPA